MLEYINKPMFVRGGCINYLLDNINYTNMKDNYKDKFRIGLSLCSFYLFYYYKYVVRIKNICYNLDRIKYDIFLVIDYI